MAGGIDCKKMRRNVRKELISQRRRLRKEGLNKANVRKATEQLMSYYMYLRTNPDD